MTIEATIIGMGRIGTSIGLALTQYKAEINRVGLDRDPDRAQKALKRGAIDRVMVNLPAAVEKADVVMLAIPVDEIQETLEVIAPCLKSGAVVIDTAPIKVPLANIASKLMPEERYYVSMVPTLNPDCLHPTEKGIDAARDDLFKNSLMAVTSMPHTHPDALKLACDMGVLMGALPFFADAHEFDGLNASSGLLPSLISAAYVNALTRQTGWREGRKLAGQAFYEASLQLDSIPEREKYGMTAMMNSENTIRVLDNLLASLTEMRSYLAANDQEGLQTFIEEAHTSRKEWLRHRKNNDWDHVIDNPPMPSTKDIFMRWLGVFGRPKNKKK